MARETKFTRRITLLLEERSYRRLQDQFLRSGARVFSEFTRDILCYQPVLYRYRNEAADEWLMIALGIKEELNELISYMRSCSHPETATVEAKFTEILLILHQIHQRCL